MSPMKAELEAMVEEATIDAYGEEEQRTGLFTMIQDHLKLPFKTKVLGIAVTVDSVDLTPSGEIVAICVHGNERQKVPILDLPWPSPAPKGSEWIAAYRHWVGGW